MPEAGEIIRNRSGQLGRVLDNGNVMPIMPGEIITNSSGERGYVMRDYSITPIRQKNISPGIDMPDSDPQSRDPEESGAWRRFSQEFAEDLEKRKAVFGEITDAYKNGEQTWAETYIQTVGKVGAGAVLDVMGNAVTEGVKLFVTGVDKVTPDFLTDPLVDGVKYASHAIIQSDVGQKGLEMALKGADAYGEWKTENPRAARNLEAVVDFGLLFAPVKHGGAKINKVPDPLATVRRPLSAVGDAAKRSAERSKQINAKIYLERSLREPGKELARDTVRRTEVAGFFKSLRTKPSRQLQDSIDEVSKLGIVDATKLHTENFHAIDDAIRAEAKSLEKLIRINAPNRNPALAGMVDNRMASILNDLTKSNPMIVGKAKESVNKVVRQAKKHYDDLPTNQKDTSIGILNARKAFDKSVESWRGKGVWNKQTAAPADLAIREARNVFNDILDSTISGNKAKASLLKQRNLYTALDGLALPALREGQNILWRAWDRALKIIPIRSQFNNVMATFTGLGGLGAAAAFAPAFSTMAISFGLGYMGGKMVAAPSTRRFMGHLLSGMDEAIALSRGDRGLLIQLTEERDELERLIKETDFSLSEVK